MACILLITSASVLVYYYVTESKLSYYPEGGIMDDGR